MKEITTPILLLIGLILTAVDLQAAEFEITALTHSGEIEWLDTNTNGHYSIEWVPSLNASNWHKDWSPATRIVATGGVLSASIPMVFRVIHYPATSPAANMVLVAGGGQPQGPQYDFYMSKYEVTEQEFADFLNDAQANTNNARGANMFFAVSGDVYLDSSQSNIEIMFDISDSNFIYFKDDPVGTRYAVFNDTMNHPVTGVSWYGALKYCNWLTINEGRGESERCYNEGTGLTNWHPAHISYAEWEDGFDNSERVAWTTAFTGFRLSMDNYGAGASFFNEFYKAAAWNGVSNMSYGFGRDLLFDQDANYENSDDPFELFLIETTPVGYYDGSDHGGMFATTSNENHYGIFDLSGNVTEWSTDAPTSGERWDRSLRGGSWNRSFVFLNNLFPENATLHFTSTDIGFRVVSTAP